MAEAPAELTSLVKAHLDSAELAGAIAYVAQAPVPAGSQLEFPSTRLVAPAEAYLVFVDGEPQANWTHSARYLLVAAADGRLLGSWEAHLPPFRSGDQLTWLVAYRAASVPESAIAISR